MSVQLLLEYVGRYPWVIVGYFLLLPLSAFLVSFSKAGPADQLNLFDYLSSGLIYAASIPGIISCVLIAYALFFVRSNLLEVDFLVYFLPVFSMFLCFYFLKKRTEFDRLPGFERLSGLMWLIGLTFLVILVLYKLRILVGFFASFETLIVVGVLVFVAFKMAARKFSGR